MGRVAASSLVMFFLCGCQVGTVDVTPGPLKPSEVMVVEVTTLGTGGTVELVKSNVNTLARSTGIDPASESYRRWRQHGLDSGHLVYAATLEAGQTASDIVYNVALQDEPIMLDVRFDGASIWKGPVGTLSGGPNHLKLVVENGEVASTDADVVEAWLEDDPNVFDLPPHGWSQPADHIQFEAGKNVGIRHDPSMKWRRK